MTHRRLRELDRADPSAVFGESAAGTSSCTCPNSFDTSILRFSQSAATDPAVLAIKLSIYRTGRRSPIVQALKEAARRGKQVAVLVEITARLDEAPNISWAKSSNRRELTSRRRGAVKRTSSWRWWCARSRTHPYVCRHGKLHEGTARLYGTSGCSARIPARRPRSGSLRRADAIRRRPGELLDAPHDLRERFTALIRREADHARAGRPCGIQAK